MVVLHFFPSQEARGEQWKEMYVFHNVVGVNNHSPLWCERLVRSTFKDLHFSVHLKSYATSGALRRSLEVIETLSFCRLNDDQDRDIWHPEMENRCYSIGAIPPF